MNSSTENVILQTDFNSFYFAFFQWFATDETVANVEKTRRAESVLSYWWLHAQARNPAGGDRRFRGFAARSGVPQNGLSGGLDPPPHRAASALRRLRATDRRHRPRVDRHHAGA